MNIKGLTEIACRRLGYTEERIQFLTEMANKKSHPQATEEAYQDLILSEDEQEQLIRKLMEMFSSMRPHSAEDFHVQVAQPAFDNHHRNLRKN